MAKFHRIASLMILAVPLVLAQQSQSKPPSVYPSIPGSKGRFVYVPGNVSMASEWKKAGFDRNAALSFKQHCSGVRVLEAPKKADYIVFFSEEWKRNLTIVRSDGEVVWTGSRVWDERSATDKACTEILKDWKEHASPNSKAAVNH
jgi:hypothetical protein